MPIFVILGCSMGVLSAGASLVGGYGLLVAALSYFGFGFLGMLAGMVFGALRTRTGTRTG
ncbi:hypothetical protein [Haematobacter genomosp. 1]|uniref:Uncharacterized protein n=2 Tax=Haematobacter TaxID=366614 RepID=A0A212AD75_9RHOB|nr:hypothetical protein [Haematobacter genomosp. 1]OWJ78976.1 hypothetical protein CDV49_07770 [Haematobacter genomosp. 1]